MPRAIPESRFQDLIEAATAVLLEQGYRRTQIADVAERMGVSKGSIYTYVESKEALFDCVLRHADRSERAEVPERLPVATPPPGATLAPEIPKYGGACPVLETGWAEGQMANILPQSVGGQNYDRTFWVIVPDDIQPDENLPVMFMWHWLGGSGQDFYERADAQEAVNAKRFIAVIPDGREADQGVLFKWPFSILDTDEQLEAEFQFFDDMLSCVHEQFGVDKDCVGSVGVTVAVAPAARLVTVAVPVPPAFVTVTV